MKKVISALFISLLSFQLVQAQKKELTKHPDALNFLVMGDWGRNGEDHQKPVATQMGKVAKTLSTDFIIATGDNFYPSGVISEHDPLWKYSFEDIYTDFSLQWDWYPVLGNHDYKSNPDAQVAYSKISRRWKMPARYYSKIFSIHGDTTKQVLIAFIDTNPLIPQFYKGEYSNATIGQDSTAQKRWLEGVLANNSPTIKWKVVVGHHPLFTATQKRRESYDTRAVRASLKSVLDKYKVDAYLCGHDHDLQHLLPEGKTHYFVSGSASEKTEIGTLPISKLALSEYGFMAFSVTDKKLYVQVINHEGNIVYTTELTK
ncbi:purple acid phosphatase family protein [Xanthocytophaga flava]|uniref:purple acid phosphatase family protein n=1 Tax=Xanthocytophaga flava TaxID=3048013 RepID=UPI0028D40FC1|nr:tartrate-resistant acid phosphatase type 5 family protein [Xanthocytophaga flavus]MDJ1467896.1 tartrate-resistant acid phosphatase type 5 family protein [Xanthocytophaga flavus]